jgi:ankyrin repeat protein
MLLERGANPNTKDITQLSPLAIACGTGGVRCIEILVRFGADLNSQSESGSTPLHECFFRDNIDSLTELIKHGPRTDLPNNYGLLPIEASFIDDMETILEFVFEQNYPDPHLSIGPHNFERMLNLAIEHSALDCVKVLLKKFDHTTLKQ